MKRAGLTLSLLICLLPSAWAGTLLVANKAEGTVTFIRSPGFEPITTLPVGTGPHEIALSPEGLRALVANYGTREEPGRTLTLLDLGKLRPTGIVELPEGARPHGIAWVKPDMAVVTAEGLGSLLVIDTDALAVVKSIPLDREGAHMLDASRDGRNAWVASIGSGSVSAVDLEQFSKRGDAAAGEGSEGIAFLRERNEIWVSNRESGTVSVFDATSLERFADIEVGGFPIRLEADNNRERVYATLAKSDELAVFDAATRQLVDKLPYDIPVEGKDDTLLSGRGMAGSIPVGLLLSRDGNLLFTAHTNAHVISVRDADTLEQLEVFSAGKEPDGMAWTWMDLPVRR